MPKIHTIDPATLPKISGAYAMRFYTAGRWHPMRWIFRKRLQLMLDLLEIPGRCNRLLEVGFGFGSLIPELSSRSRHYVGLDMHDYTHTVRNSLPESEQNIHLLKGDARNIPFESDFFDCAFSLSVLEHIPDVEDAVGEIRRVLAPGGHFVVGFPIENTASNLVLDLVKVMIGFDRKEHHHSDHNKILRALEERMHPVKQRPYPLASSVAHSLFYTGVWRKE